MVGSPAGRVLTPLPSTDVTVQPCRRPFMPPDVCTRPACLARLSLPVCQVHTPPLTPMLGAYHILIASCFFSIEPANPSVRERVVNVCKPLATLPSSEARLVPAFSSSSYPVPLDTAVECMNEGHAHIFPTEEVPLIHPAAPGCGRGLFPCPPTVPSAFLHPALDTRHCILYPRLGARVLQCLPREPAPR